MFEVVGGRHPSGQHGDVPAGGVWKSWPGAFGKSGGRQVKDALRIPLLGLLLMDVH